MHFQRHHGFPARFSCHICKYAFHNPIAVENHQARYQGDCVANFHPVVLRIEHPHQFNGISFICGNCKNSFGSQISLLSHQLACNENQRYIKKELVAIKQEPLEDSKVLLKICF